MITPKLLAAGAATSVMALLLVFNAVATNTGIAAAAAPPSTKATVDKIDVVSHALFKTKLPTGGVNAYIVGEVKNNNDHPVRFVNLEISV